MWLKYVWYIEIYKLQPRWNAACRLAIVDENALIIYRVFQAYRRKKNARALARIADMISTDFGANLTNEPSPSFATFVARRPRWCNSIEWSLHQLSGLCFYMQISISCSALSRTSLFVIIPSRALEILICDTSLLVPKVFGSCREHIRRCS